VARSGDRRPHRIAIRQPPEIYGLCGDCQADGVTVKYEGLNCPAIDFSN
jgi:hypothetical protein